MGGGNVSASGSTSIVARASEGDAGFENTTTNNDNTNNFTDPSSSTQSLNQPTHPQQQHADLSDSVRMIENLTSTSSATDWHHLDTDFFSLPALNIGSMAGAPFGNTQHSHHHHHNTHNTHNTHNQNDHQTQQHGGTLGSSSTMGGGMRGGVHREFSEDSLGDLPLFPVFDSIESFDFAGLGHIL